MNIMGEDDKPMGLCHCGSKFATTWAQWHFAARAFCFFWIGEVSTELALEDCFAV